MGNLTAFIYIAIFIFGIASGVVITYFGFKLGFRANVEARLQEDEVPESKRLFKDKEEPAELELLNHNRKEKSCVFQIPGRR